MNIPGLSTVRVLNFQGYTGFIFFRKYSRIPNRLDFRYIKMLHKVLNMTELCLHKLFWLYWLWQGSEYACSKFHKVLNMPPVFNMPGLGIWQVCEYARVAKDAKYPWIRLNMREYALKMLNMIVNVESWLCLL